MSKSKGEQAIKTILNCLGLEFIHDKPLECLDNDKLRPDFVLEGYKIVIEYQGERHFVDYGKDKVKDVYQKDIEKYRDLVFHGYTVLYAVFPEITKNIEFPENYIDTLYTTPEELRSKLIELTNKKVMDKKTHFPYIANDLSFAKVCSVNRSISPSHVNDILKGLDTDYGWRRIDRETIKVDMDTDEIVDGNHRYLALEKYMKEHGKFKIPIHYEYIKREPGESLASTIRSYNSGNKPLTGKDYVRLAENDGNNSVTLVREFGESHTLTQKLNKKGNKVIGYSERITEYIIFGRNVSKEIKNNTLTVTEAEIRGGGEKRHEEISNLKMVIERSLGITLNTQQLASLSLSWYDLTINDSFFKDKLSKVVMKDFYNQVGIDSLNWSVEEIKDKDSWSNKLRTVLYNITFEN